MHGTIRAQTGDGLALCCTRMRLAYHRCICAPLQRCTCIPARIFRLRVSWTKPLSSPPSLIQPLINARRRAYPASNFWVIDNVCARYAVRVSMAVAIGWLWTCNLHLIRVCRPTRGVEQAPARLLQCHSCPAIARRLWLSCNDESLAKRPAAVSNTLLCHGARCTCDHKKERVTVTTNSLVYVLHLRHTEQIM